MHRVCGGLTLLMLVTVAATHVEAQQSDAQRARAALFRAKTVPFEPGFRVFIVPDMEGMGSTVDSREVLAGNEGEAFKKIAGV